MPSAEHPVLKLFAAGRTEFFAGRLHSAEEAFRTALRLQPRHPDCLHYLGVIQYFRHDYVSALHLIESALPHRRKDPEIHGNLGLVKQALGDYSGAVRCLQNAIRYAPTHASFHAQLGTVLRDDGRLQEALKECDRALALKPNLALARFNRAICRLLNGDLHSVWEDYQYRVRIDEITGSPSPISAINIQDRLDRLAPRLPRLVVHHEQGIGDELFFLRFAPLARQRCSWLGYVASDKIAPLLAGTDTFDAVFVTRQAAPASDFDLFVGDLPLSASITCNENAPPPLPLRPNAAKSHQAAQILRTLPPPPYLGITWTAGAQPSVGIAPRRRKSVPLALLADVLRAWPGTILSLQRMPVLSDLEELQQRTGRYIHDLAELNDDIPLMLAMLARIDEYIGVSNANMHLRASLGKAARVLVSVPPDWRWTEAGLSSPWFPNFALYRESRTQGWQPSLESLANDLSAAYSALAAKTASTSAMP